MPLLGDKHGPGAILINNDFVQSLQLEHCNRLVSQYQAMATSMFGGSGVVSVATDAASSSGVYVAAGSTLFRVTILGSVTTIGRIQDANAPGLLSLVPSSMVFYSPNRQCPSQNTTGKVLLLA